jgi:hypothetical protein
VTIMTNPPHWSPWNKLTVKQKKYQLAQGRKLLRERRDDYREKRAAYRAHPGRFRDTSIYNMGWTGADEAYPIDSRNEWNERHGWHMEWIAKVIEGNQGTDWPLPEKYIALLNREGA